jgi:adenosylcobinamide-GDP ribazoletransferase
MRGLITAIRTLTLLPVPGKDSEKMSDSLPFFPLVGALIGLLPVGISFVVGIKYGWPIGAGLLCVGAVTLLTGGLHLDGLADAFDALGGRTIQRRLEIMKDSRIGSFGVIALVLIVIAKIISISRLTEAGRYWQLIIPFIVSRTLQVHLIVALPYARAEGGMGQKFVEGATMYHFVVAYIVGLMLCFAFGNVMAVITGIVACLFCSILTSWIRRMFGGITGDLIGMGSELFETGIMVIFGLIV